MNVDLDEAIAIYAHVSRSWFKEQARNKVQERIRQLAAAGDTEGVDVHERVKQRILELENNTAASRARSRLS
jgi:hypothetical protein